MMGLYPFNDPFQYNILSVHSYYPTHPITRRCGLDTRTLLQNLVLSYQQPVRINSLSIPCNAKHFHSTLHSTSSQGSTNIPSKNQHKVHYQHNASLIHNRQIIQIILSSKIWHILLQHHPLFCP